ncbi:hypothetical protein [Rhodococcus aerolatus]
MAGLAARRARPPVAYGVPLDEIARRVGMRPESLRTSLRRRTRGQ